MPYYKGTRCIQPPIPQEYKQAREYTFGKGGFIKDSSGVIASLLATKPYKGKPYIKNTDEVINTFLNCFPEGIEDYVRFEIIDTIMLKITNAFQQLDQGNPDKALELIDELNNLLQFYIDKMGRNDITCQIKVSLDTENYCYTVELIQEQSS